MKATRSDRGRSRVISGTSGNEPVTRSNERGANLARNAGVERYTGWDIERHYGSRCRSAFVADAAHGTPPGGRVERADRRVISDVLALIAPHGLGIALPARVELRRSSEGMLLYERNFANFGRCLGCTRACNRTVAGLSRSQRPDKSHQAVQPTPRRRCSSRSARRTRRGPCEARPSALHVDARPNARLTRRLINQAHPLPALRGDVPPAVPCSLCHGCW